MLLSSCTTTTTANVYLLTEKFTFVRERRRRKGQTTRILIYYCDSGFLRRFGWRERDSCLLSPKGSHSGERKLPGGIYEGKRKLFRSLQMSCTIAPYKIHLPAKSRGLPCSTGSSHACTRLSNHHCPRP